MRKYIVESCCEYLKHPPDAGEYVSKKIMVIRCVEISMKQENDVTSQKVALKKGCLHRTVGIWSDTVGKIEKTSSSQQGFRTPENLPPQLILQPC